MSDETTERDVEALAAAIHAGSVHRLGMSSGPCDICTRVARAVLASDWYAERIAQAHAEGAAEAWNEGWNAAVDSDGFPGDVNPYRTALNPEHEGGGS